MINRPTRSTAAGRAYLDLQSLARRQHRPTDELHQIYALEGFLARLVVSPYAKKLVLKGGVLLAAYDTRRPTRDVDLHGQRISNSLADVRTVVRDIAQIDLDDGLSLHGDDARAEGIRDEEIYSGVRVTLTGELSVAKLTFHVDVNVGDPIWPAPQQIVLPRLLHGQIVLTGYPLSMVHAEKLVTAVQRGLANTRWRDFADVYTLARRHEVDADELTAALRRVARHRQVRMVPLAQVLNGYATLAQPRWAAWRRRQRLDDRLPERFDDVLDSIIRFADPVIEETIAGVMWSPGTESWTTDIG